MPHLFRVWPSVLDRIRRSGRILLLLDYDGTLTPIVSHPDQANMSPDTRQLLVDLNANARIVLGVISGRNLADLRQRVNVPDIIYAGNHGLEMAGLGQPFVHPEAMAQTDALASICLQLDRSLAQYPGILVENKGLTLSVHYRQTPENLVGPVEEQFNQVVAPGIGAGTIKITRGKMVLEVRPNVDWDKGKAVARIVEGLFGGKSPDGKSPDDKSSDDALPEDSMAEKTSAAGTPVGGQLISGTLVAYFGDDLTDEAGFGVVQEAGGIAVFVGPAGQTTQARYRVDSPDQVAETLRMLRSS